MVKTSLPPGFRFHPTDAELIVYHLKRKIMGKKLHSDAIAEVDVYKNAPWDLPDKSCLKSKDLKWYFFCAIEKKYASGARMKRATEYGYWKATGKDRPVHYNGKVVGMIKTLVFHQGKHPKGNRTDWVMHEYRLEDKDLEEGVVQDAYVLSVVFQKDGIGPRNGAQYGAPFKEEEWSDDEEVNCGEVVSFAGQSMPTVLPSQNKTNHVTAMAHPTESICNAAAPDDSCLPDSQIASCTVLPSLPSVSVINCCEVQNDIDMDSLLAQFTEEDASGRYETNIIEEHDNVSQRNDIISPFLDFVPDDIFKDLDLSVLAELGTMDQGRSNISGYKLPYLLTEMLPRDDIPFLELLDLDQPLNSPTGVSSSNQPMRSGCSHADLDSPFLELLDLDQQLNSPTRVSTSMCSGFSYANPDSPFLELLDLDQPLNSPTGVSASNQQMRSGGSYANTDNNNA